MCVLLLDSLRLFHKHTLLWSTLTVERSVGVGSRVGKQLSRFEDQEAPAERKVEAQGSPTIALFCLREGGGGVEKEVPPGLGIFTVFLKSKPFTCDFLPQSPQEIFFVQVVS